MTSSQVTLQTTEKITHASVFVKIQGSGQLQIDLNENDHGSFTHLMQTIRSEIISYAHGDFRKGMTEICKDLGDDPAESSIEVDSSIRHSDLNFKATIKLKFERDLPAHLQRNAAGLLLSTCLRSAFGHSQAARAALSAPDENTAIDVQPGDVHQLQLPAELVQRLLVAQAAQNVPTAAAVSSKRYDGPGQYL